MMTIELNQRPFFLLCIESVVTQTFSRKLNLYIMCLQIMDNLCTLIHDQPLDSIHMVDCLSNLMLTILPQEKLLRIMLKKSRGFYMHELKNEPTEWIRRKLYYNGVLQILKSLDSSRSEKGTKIEQDGALQFVNFVKKNVLKDRKQSQIEDVVSQVQLLCEKWTD